MDIGIGLPNTLDADGATVVAWARRAEERGFRSLATIDRIVYPTYDSLTSLAVAAGATSRIGLLTDILLTPLYPPVWLAKASASLHATSGGRLTLGLGVGSRPDDFAAMQRDMAQRGKLMDQALDLLERAWAGEGVTGGFPVVPGAAAGSKVPVLIGGTTDAAVRRTVRYGDGWTAGGGGPQAAGPMVEKIRRAWREAGREDEPRFAALVYFGLGDEKASRASLHKYYGFLGEWADTIADSAIRTPQAARNATRTYAGVGVTELVFIPTVPSLDEVDRLADAVL
ncbi:MAG: LLM class flavin-dependent oxidoreductase [Micromonosporaceae bacterium]|jgi:alkanesulfonate monooxygenase SsuD/methylene tetrahydromethanopterin reductase-like flavin-dependent oxidoreductase (luciferase family)|nr:LLM class flavin-dependent oxidoreductase [Micromonosporaceae bacterium]